MSTTIAATEADSPPGQPSPTSPMNVSQDHETIPDLADIRAELHAFAVEMTQEISAIQALLSGAPSSPADPAPPAAKRNEPAPSPRDESASHEKDSDADKVNSGAYEQNLGEPVHIPAAACPAAPTRAQEDGPRKEPPQPEIEDAPQAAPSRVKTTAASDVVDREEVAKESAATNVHDQDRLSALKKRLAEKLRAEGMK